MLVFFLFFLLSPRRNISNGNTTKIQFKLSPPLLDLFNHDVSDNNIGSALDFLNKDLKLSMNNDEFIDNPSLLRDYWENKRPPISEQRIFYRREIICLTTLYLIDHYINHKMPNFHPSNAFIRFNRNFNTVIQSIDDEQIQNPKIINLRRSALSEIIKMCHQSTHSSLFCTISNVLCDKTELINRLNTINYTISDRIGQGTYGVVYKVIKQNDTTTAYALKAFHSKRECRKEETILNQLRYSSISIAHIQFNDVINCAHTSAFMMDLIDGVTLQNADKYVWFHPNGIYGFINDFGTAMDGIIQTIGPLNICHCDIAINNIMYNTQKHSFHLIDWGSAKDMSNQQNIKSFYCMCSMHLIPSFTNSEHTKHIATFQYYSPFGWTLHSHCRQNMDLRKINQQLAMQNDMYAVRALQVQMLEHETLTPSLSSTTRKLLKILRKFSYFVGHKVNDLIKCDVEWDTKGYVYLLKLWKYRSTVVQHLRTQDSLTKRIDMDKIAVILCNASDYDGSWFPITYDLDESFYFIQHQYIVPLAVEAAKFHEKGIKKVIDFQYMFARLFWDIPPFLIQDHYADATEEEKFADLIRFQAFGSDIIHQIDIMRIGEFAVRFIQMFCDRYVSDHCRGRRANAIDELLRAIELVYYKTFTVRECTTSDVRLEGLLNDIVPKNHTLNRIMFQYIIPFLSRLEFV